jgi:osmotically-inducible protein OsmY
VEYRGYEAEIGPFLNDHYRDNPMSADDEINFDVQNGVVTLTGDVDSAAERDQLVQWANAVPGVREVKTDGRRIP